MYPYTNSYSQLSPKEREQQSEKVKKAIDIIKGSKVESILDYGIRDGYINAIFLDEGNEYNFAMNTENGRFEYYLSGRKDPFMSNTDPYSSSYRADPNSIYNLESNDSFYSSSSSKVRGFLRDHTDTFTEREILEEIRQLDDELSGDEDMDNPIVRAKVLTEIIESVYGKGGIDKIISYGVKGDLIIGQFTATGQDFDFEINPNKGTINYQPVLTAKQKLELEKNKDSFDSYALGQCLAIADDIGLKVPPGKRPEWVQGYLMELNPQPFFH